MGDTQARENAYHLMLATDTVENMLNAAHEGSEMAKISLATMKEKRTYKKKSKGE
jgi:hypothetical protein